MTDEKIMEHFEKMKEIYGEAVPNPDHNPVLFAYYVKMYKTYHKEEYDHVQAD